MPASSSSSAGPSPGFAVYLYDNNFNRIALVDITVPVPNLINYLGNRYVWSNVHGAFFPAVEQVVTGDLGSPQLSVLANPQQ
jgi:hypothetical protein